MAVTKKSTISKSKKPSEKEKKVTGTGSKKPTATKTKKTTTKKDTTVKKSTKKVEEVEDKKEEETIAEAASKRLARKDAAVSKAKKALKPLDATDMANSIADIVSNAYNLSKPKGKDIAVSAPEEIKLNRIPINMKTNWGMHCHEYQVKMFVDCLAHKMQYEVRNFQLRPDMVIFELYGPFPDIKVEE